MIAFRSYVLPDSDSDGNDSGSSYASDEDDFQEPLYDYEDVTPSEDSSMTSMSSLSVRDNPRSFRKNAATMMRETNAMMYNGINGNNAGCLHNVLLKAMGSLYMAKDTVERILAPENGVQKSVLDIGAGEGMWVRDIGVAFPHVEVIGIDQAPGPSTTLPRNCRLQYDDVSLGLQHYYGQFDVVHLRSSCGGIPHFREFIGEMGRCLKPGGILLLVEGELQLYTPARQLATPAYGEGGSGQSWTARAISDCYAVMKSRRTPINAGPLLHHFLRENPIFENDAVEALRLFLPIGPWEVGRTKEETENLEVIGRWMRKNVKDFVKALKPFLMGEGFREKLVDQFITGTDRELDDLSVHLYGRWHYACAIKKANLPRSVEFAEALPPNNVPSSRIPDLTPEDEEEEGEPPALTAKDYFRMRSGGSILPLYHSRGLER